MKRTWLLLTTVMIAGGVVSLAGGPAMTSRSTSDPFTVGCYDTLSQQADTMVLAFKGNGNLDAASICAKEWQAQGHPVSPNLATCVVTGGGLGVFQNPSGMNVEDACASIGASVPEGGTPYGGLSAEEVRAFDRAIASRYEATWDPSGPTCRGVGVLRRVVDSTISAKATGSWSGQDLTTASGDHCATFTIDALKAKVIMTNVS
jgi:hypothetical protein